MKTITLVTFSILISIIGNYSFSQNLDIKWSEKIESKKNDDGYFLNYIGANEKNVYALFRNDLADFNLKTLKIVSFENSTMAKNASVPLLGFKENATLKAIYSKLTFFKVVVKEEAVYVFWTKIDKQIEELYVEKFDSKLNRLKDLKMLSKNTIPSDIKKAILFKDGHSFVVQDNKEDIVVGYELPKNGSFTVFKYSQLDADLNLSEETQVQLPYKLERDYYGLTSVYDLLKNGDLVIKSYIQEKDKKGTMALDRRLGVQIVNCNFVLTYHKMSTGENTNLKFSIKDKAIQDFKFVLNKDEFKVYGLVYNLISQPDKAVAEGVVSTVLNVNTLQKEELNFLPFDKKALETLYSKYVGSDVKNDNFENNNLARITLDTVISVNQNNDVLSFSNFAFVDMQTPTTTGPNGMIGGGSFPKLHKRDIVLMNLNEKLEITWTSSIKRSANYFLPFQVSRDVYITAQNSDLKIVFGMDTKEYSDAQYTQSMSKKRSASKNQIGCASIDLISGTLVQKKVLLNEDEETKTKQIYLPNIKIFNNVFYTDFYDMMYDTQSSGFLGAIKFE